MKKRLFFAILLEENLKNQILLYKKEIQKKFKKNPLKEAEEPHITILFLGYIEEEKIKEIIKIGERIKKEFQPFQINFKLIEFGSKVPYRLIWLKGEENKNLERLKERLTEELEKKNIKFQKENRKIIPHITLFRIKKFSFYKNLLQKRVDISLEVKGFHLMESVLSPYGAKYYPLKEFIL